MRRDAGQGAGLVLDSEVAIEALQQPPEQPARQLGDADEFTNAGRPQRQVLRDGRDALALGGHVDLVTGGGRARDDHHIGVRTGQRGVQCAPLVDQVGLQQQEVPAAEQITGAGE